MKICFVGLDNLPVLAKEFASFGVGGEQVQQTLLANAFIRRGHKVSMVVYDYGQEDGKVWDEVTTYRAYCEKSGIPIIRFLYPRWSKTWSALKNADADVYYVSCAGMQLGLVALFCTKYNRKFYFRVAHDTDCDPNSLLIKYYRDKKLYEYGLRRAAAIFVQTESQKNALAKNYGLPSQLARMLVQRPVDSKERTADILWVNNFRPFKRPDLLVALARSMPDHRFCMIGGEQPGCSELYNHILREADTVKNIDFYGRVPYHEMARHYANAKVFVNTSDSEGFPNSYLQAWIHGTPTVAFFDPDGTIKREKLGYVASSIEDMKMGVLRFLVQEDLWRRASERCLGFMDENYNEEDVVLPYVRAIEGVS